MSGRLDAELAQELDSLDRQGRRRAWPAPSAPGPDAARESETGHGSETARRADFCSNDTLGLARHPLVVAAARDALEAEGLGGRAARLLGGGGSGQVALEQEAADWLGCAATLLFPSGYQANLGVVTALADRGDVVLSDALVHASLVDAARLSRAQVHVHAHADLTGLELLLGRSRGARRRIVLTEGVFGMDGDSPDLVALGELCVRHDAVLVVDEAHAAGLLGPEGAGAWTAQGGPASGADCLRIVTGGKALGGAGALVAGSRVLCELLANRARSFVFTTAPPPAVAAGLRAAIAVLRGDAALRARPLELARRLARRLAAPEPSAAIVPHVLGDERAALAAAADLATRFDLRAVRPPTVPEGTSRLRLVCHASNDEAEVDALAEALVAFPSTGPVARDRRGVEVAAAAARGHVLFVTGTGTEVGKTVVSALLLRAALQAGTASRYWKPVQCGPDSDTGTVRSLADAPLAACIPPRWQLEAPASPDQAAAAEGLRLSLTELDAELDGHLGHGGLFVTELAGGLLVPYGDHSLQIDWLARRPGSSILVARSTLGTLNHTLLSLEALRRRGLEPEALILVGPPHPANRASLERHGQPRRLLELPVLEPLDTARLDHWLAHHDLSWAWHDETPTT